MEPLVISGILLLFACLCFYAARRSVQKERDLADITASQQEEVMFDLYNRQVRIKQRPSPSEPNSDYFCSLSQSQITHGERVAARRKQNGNA